MPFTNAVVALATYAVAMSALLLGTLAGARRPSVALVSGWGIAVSVLTLGGTLTDIGLTKLLAGLGLVSLCGLWRWKRLCWQATMPVLLLGIPLLLIASANTSAGYDEYAHWLPNILYLVRYDHFPQLAGPQSVSIRPGYPYGSAFIGLAASRLTGGLAETAVMNWNALLNVAVAALAGEGLMALSPGIARWRTAAVAVLFCGVLSPDFVPGLYLSNYGDAITGKVAAVIVGAILLDGIGGVRPSVGLLIGLAAAALVAIRQDSFSILAIVWISWALLVLWQRNGRPWAQDWFGLLASIPAPLAIWWSWHHYQVAQIPDGSASLLPWTAWRWDDLAAICRSILHTLMLKSGYTATIIAATGIGLFARHLPVRQREAGLFGSALGLGHIASMIGIYLAVVTGGASARSAPEFWRFIQHIAPAVVLCCLLALPLQRLLAMPRARYLPMLALAVQCGGYPFLRIDTPRPHHVAYLYLRQIAQDIAASLPQGAHLALIETETDPGTSQENVPRRSRLLALRPDISPADLFLVAGSPARQVVIAANLPQIEPLAGLPKDTDYIWIADGDRETSRLLGRDILHGESKLFRRSGSTWTALSSWPRPE